MDDKWFKAQQKKVGVTADDIARRMGRTRSNVSHIYSGKQRMSLDWAQAFAEVLHVPLHDVLKHAGILEETLDRPIARGFSEGDATPWTGKGGEDAQVRDRAACFGGGKPGTDIWTVQSSALQFAGYLPGDFILVDTHQSERCRAGDVVIAQKYDWKTGTATTVLRRYEPPVLVASGPDPDDQRVLVVDGNQVAISGKVIASWRT